MDINLKRLIESEVKKVVGEAIPPLGSDQDVSDTQTDMSRGGKLMQMPGAPIVGNAGVGGNVPMNNESRLALKNWMRVAKKVMEKYPEPSTIPPQMKEMLERLGSKFDQFNQVPNSVGYGNM